MKSFVWYPINKKPKKSDNVWGRDFLVWVSDDKIEFCYPDFFVWDFEHKKFRYSSSYSKFWEDGGNSKLKITKWCVVPNAKTVNQ